MCEIGRMRICMLTGSFLPKVGGMEYAIHHLAQSLCELGVHVTVFCHASCGRLDFTYPYEIVRYGSILPFSGRSGLDRYLGVLKFKKYHRKQNIDIIHCHNVSYPGEIAVRAKRALGVSLVMTPHGQDVQKIPDINYGVRLNPKWEQKIRQHLNYADAVTMISESIERSIEFVSPEKVYRIPNGVNIADFSGPRTNFLHNFLGLKEDTKIIISVGRNHRVKGYEIGIKAFASSGIYRDMNVKYVIIGQGVESLEEVVKELNVANHVHLIPGLPLKKVVHCYHSAYLFFSPSFAEGLSLVSIEAMAAGLPILATDVPGNRDIVKENNCGMLVPVGDIPAMAASLRTLILKRDLRDSYAQQSLKKRFKYDWSNIAKQYMEVYMHLAHTC